MVYIILQEGTKHDLEQSVNRKIKEGYIPQGGVSFDYEHLSGRSDYRAYAQAMIKD